MRDDETVLPVKGFPVVGIGASAGGLESLEKLFRALPCKPGAAFLVVQHLAPDFKSLMDELLSRYTNLPVHRATDDLEVLSDHVYLLPPGKEMEFREGRLRLFDRDPRASLTLPINRTLTSLAEDARERAVAIILSGSGSDGSIGAKRVREAGGLVLVEDPESARFDGMPRAAVDFADFVQPADSLARALVERAESDAEAALSRDDGALVARALVLLRNALAIDFAQYKLPTVSRRIQRRVALRQLPDLQAYVDALTAEPDEVLALGHDLLIGVTRFFRDPATWDALEELVAPRLVREAAPSGAVRAWVAGCATGEEAFSLAMCLLDAARALPGVAVKVFATDVHRRALDHAGRGAYDVECLRHVPEARRERYFARRADGLYQVTPELRQSVIFAHHNVLRDAPFTQLDLVTCRNLLIYFKHAGQRQALSLLQYGLRVGGVLLLGPSETPGDNASAFVALDEAHRLYTKQRATERIPEIAVSRKPASPPRPSGAATEPSLIGLYDAVLNRVMPPAFLLDLERNLVDSFGGAERFIRYRARRPSTDLAQLVPEAAQLALVSALARARRERVTVRHEDVSWALDHEPSTVSLRVEPIEREGRLHAYLVVLEPRSPDASPAEAIVLRPSAHRAEDADRLASLEQELQHVRRSLQSTVEELETNSEEMQATNEELVASNEELQSTNEELHSVNEELHTVNAELHAKNRELSVLNRDMGLLFESIDAVIVFLDRDLRIRRFTPGAGVMFGLLEHDLGRPLAGFRHPLKRPALMADVARCHAERQPCEYEVADDRGRTHLVRIKSYVDAQGEGGVLLSITDVSTLTAARRQADLLSAIVESSADAIIAFDEQRVVTSWNAAATQLYGYTEREALGMRFDRVVPAEHDAELRAVLKRVWSGQTMSLETVRRHRDGELIDVATTLSPVRDPEGNVVGASKIDRDIRERKLREAALAEREQRLTDLYENSPDMFVSVDMHTGRLVDFNTTLARNLGYTPEELARMHYTELYPSEERDRARGLSETLRRAGEFRDVEITLRRKDGQALEVSISATAVRDARGEVARSRTVIRDDTSRKHAERALRQTARVRERFLAIVSHELRTPLYAASSATTLLADPASSEAVRRRAVAVLGRQTAQMTRLLDDLLDVSRISGDRLHLIKAPLDLREPVRAALEACAPAYEAKRVALVSRVMESPLPLSGDSARLQQVVINLLNNALRHSSAGARVHVDVLRAGDTGRVVVRDEGEGIDPSTLGEIFEMFGKSGDRAPTGGLGVGLSLARGIIEGHHGTILAESEGLGRGARFSVALPIEEVVLAERATRPAGSPLRLVVVEDQTDSLEMISLLLEMRGYHVTATMNGREGIDAIIRERPDVALVDIGLPDVDGYQVARRVRATLGAAVSLVALTGYSQPEDVARSRDAGFDRHLTKPLDPDSLEQTIQQVVRHAESAVG